MQGDCEKIAVKRHRSAPRSDAPRPVNKSRRSLSLALKYLMLFTCVTVLVFVRTMHYTTIVLASASFSVDDAVPSLLNERKAAGRAPQKEKRFAYAFIVSGCSETSCHGYVLNAVVAAQVLRSTNSTADLVFMVRMASRVPETRLSSDQERLLHKAGLKLRYLKKLKRDNFGTATLEKFRVLELHQDYDRVLFLDSDIIPLCNMDYMFEESYNPVGMFSDYVAYAGSAAPMTAAFFLVTPKKGEFTRVIDIVRRHREQTAMDIVRRHHRGQKPASSNTRAEQFDQHVGWGHVIEPPDVWRSWYKKGNQWNFKAAPSDQGILYMYFKYMLLNFTQIYTTPPPTNVQTWKEVTNDVIYWKNRTNVIEVEGGKFVAKVDENHDGLKGCGGRLLGRKKRFFSHPPTSDFFHFKGGTKPWNREIIPGDLPKNFTDYVEVDQAQGRDFWIYFLAQANETLGLELPSEIVVKKGNPLAYGNRGNDLFHKNVELPTEIFE